MTSNDIPLLFLSGAGLPGWIWDDARAHLPSSRPSAVAVQPGDTATSLAGHAQRVLDEVGWPRVVLVAHSIGGVVAAALAHRDPPRIAGVLAVAAVVPAPGRSFLRSLPLPNRVALGAMIRVAGTRPPDKAIRTGLTGGLDSAVADRVVGGFSPAPAWLYRDSTPEYRFGPRRGYLFTSEDREISPRLQEGFARELDPRWHRTLATGHLPMLAAAEPFARAVEEFCAAEVDDRPAS